MDYRRLSYAALMCRGQCDIGLSDLSGSAVHGKSVEDPE